jgi:hypothetical protein
MKNPVSQKQKQNSSAGIRYGRLNQIKIGTARTFAKYSLPSPNSHEK